MQSGRRSAMRRVMQSRVQCTCVKSWSGQRWVMEYPPKWMNEPEARVCAFLPGLGAVHGVTEAHQGGARDMRETCLTKPIKAPQPKSAKQTEKIKRRSSHIRRGGEK